MNILRKLGQRHVYQDEADGGEGEGGTGAGGGTGEGDGDAAALAAAAAAAAAKGEGEGGEGEGGQQQPDPWNTSAPDDWRELISGDDESRLDKAKRYNSFGEFCDGAFDAHAKIRKGEVSTGLPENATDEQLATFREANNIPVDGKYELSLEEGVSVTPDDQSILDEVFPVAQAGNVDQATMSAITSKFIQARDAQVDAILAQDGQDNIATQAHLKEAWGGDYEVNNQMIDNMLTRELPEDMQEVFRTARDGEGKGLLNNPAVVKMLASLERQINPMSTIPGGAENASNTARDIVNQAKKYQASSDPADKKAYDDPAFQSKYDAAITHLQKQGEKI